MSNDVDDTQDQDAPDTSADDAADDTADDSSDDSPAAPAAINPTVAAYLQQQQQQGQAGLAAAQQKANMNQLLAGIGRSASTLAQSGYGHTAPVDTSAFDSLDKAAQAPVQQFQAEQAEAKSDPASPQSQAVQSMIQKLYPGKFTPEQLAAVSADDAENLIYKPLELDQKVKATAQSKADAIASRADTRSDAAATREDAKQGAAMGSTISMLESARGAPQIQQAEKDVYAASKLNTLISQFGDPNNLSPNMAALAVSEVGKIGSGGTPDDAMMHKLTPSTLPSKLASMWQSVSGNPQPANVGAFLKQYQDYANGVTKDAQQTIEDRYGRIIDANSDRLGDSNVQKLKTNYINRFKPLTETGPSGSGQSNAHPQDSQAIQWAKSNPTDPRSAKILQLNGGQ